MRLKKLSVITLSYAFLQFTFSPTIAAGLFDHRIIDDRGASQDIASSEIGAEEVRKLANRAAGNQISIHELHMDQARMEVEAQDAYGEDEAKRHLEIKDALVKGAQARKKFQRAINKIIIQENKGARLSQELPSAGSLDDVGTDREKSNQVISEYLQKATAWRHATVTTAAHLKGTGSLSDYRDAVAQGEDLIAKQRDVLAAQKRRAEYRAQTKAL